MTLVQLIAPTSSIIRVEYVFDAIGRFFSDPCFRKGTDHSNLVNLFDCLGATGTQRECQC